MAVTLSLSLSPASTCATLLAIRPSRKMVVSEARTVSLSTTADSCRPAQPQLGSARLGSARLGSARLGSARLGSDESFLRDNWLSTFQHWGFEGVLQRFFGGRPADYSDRDHRKAAKFADFLQTHAADLAELNLSETSLRRCVRAHVCHSLLPVAVRDELSWSGLLQISTYDEVNGRAQLAMATVAQKWPVAKVKEAVAQAHQRRLWDADPNTDGLQLPPPKPEPAVQPGRLVSRTEKWTEDVGAWHQEFAQIDPSKLSKAQVDRIRTAVATLRGQLDQLEKALR